jgi:hypothetical protein
MFLKCFWFFYSLYDSKVLIYVYQDIENNIVFKKSIFILFSFFQVLDTQN